MSLGDPRARETNTRYVKRSDSRFICVSNENLRFYTSLFLASTLYRAYK